MQIDNLPLNIENRDELLADNLIETIFYFLCLFGDKIKAFFPLF